MSLPIRTTLDDINDVCGYLATKPTGATSAEAKAVVDKKRLDSRKITALKFWRLIEVDGNKMKLTDRGRLAARQSGASRSAVLREVVREVPPYVAIVERDAHRNEGTITSTEVAAHWHEHFRSDVSNSDKILNDQAVCFFQIAEGADLGKLVIGRRGSPTRFDFDAGTVSAFVGELITDTPFSPAADDSTEGDDLAGATSVDSKDGKADDTTTYGNRVFITHGKNSKILNQVKELVTYGKLEPVVAMERETAAKPVPQKVMDDMRMCGAAVIHVSAEGVLYDQANREVPQINGNVLIEIGAAMALYGQRFVLLVEQGVDLPSNLQGLYECRYEGDELDMPATMKLLKALSEF